MLNDFLACLGFFTTLPLPRKHFQIDSLTRIAPWVPAVGLLIGIILTFSQSIFSTFLPPLLAAGFVLVSWIAISGGLHLDGLADCFDAFMCATSAEKRKQILKDPHLGTYGVIGICLTLIIKLLLIYSQALSSFVISDINLKLSVGLLIAPAVSRWSILWLNIFYPIGKEGLGDYFSKGITMRSLGLASLVPIILMVIFGIKVIVAVLLSILMIWIIGRLAVNKIGEIRGDVMGMAIEFNEILNLFVCVF